MAAASGALRGHVGPLPNKQLQSPVRASAVRDRRPTIAAASKDHLHAAERRENLGEGFESGVGPMHSPLSAQATHGGSMQRRHLLAAAVPAAAALAMLGPAAGSAQAAFACPGEQQGCGKVAFAWHARDGTPQALPVCQACPPPNVAL